MRGGGPLTTILLGETLWRTVWLNILRQGDFVVLENGIEPQLGQVITLVDLSEEWIVSREALVSRSSNSPYLGRGLTSRVVGTIVGGELVHDRTGAKFGVRA